MSKPTGMTTVVSDVERLISLRHSPRLSDESCIFMPSPDRVMRRTSKKPEKDRCSMIRYQIICRWHGAYPSLFSAIRSLRSWRSGCQDISPQLGQIPLWVRTIISKASGHILLRTKQESALGSTPPYKFKLYPSRCHSKCSKTTLVGQQDANKPIQCCPVIPISIPPSASEPS